MENQMQSTPRSSSNRSRIPVPRSSRSSNDSLSFDHLPGPSRVNRRPKKISPISGIMNLDNSSISEIHAALSSTNERIENMFVDRPSVPRDNLNNRPDSSALLSLRREEGRIPSQSTYEEPNDENAPAMNLEDNDLVLSDETYDDDINSYSPIGVENPQVSNLEWYTLQPEAILDEQDPSNLQPPFSVSRGREPANSSDNVINNYFPLSENLDSHWKRLREIYSHHIVEKFKELLAKEQLKICLEFNSRSFDEDIHGDKEAEDDNKAIKVLKEEFEKLQVVLASSKDQKPILGQNDWDSNMDHEYTLQFVF